MKVYVTSIRPFFRNCDRIGVAAIPEKYVEGRFAARREWFFEDEGKTRERIEKFDCIDGEVRVRYYLVGLKDGRIKGYMSIDSTVDEYVASNGGAEITETLEL